MLTHMQKIEAAVITRILHKHTIDVFFLDPVLKLQSVYGDCQKLFNRQKEAVFALSSFLVELNVLSHPL